MTASPDGAEGCTVVVLGMHRSGTSLVSSLVQALGVFGGEEHERLLPDDWNARGYFEVQAVLSLNERLLRTGGYELSLPPIDLGWLPSPDPDAPLRQDARALVESFRARGHGQWVWKDPRFSITLPWWRPMLGRVVPVLCLRHPAAVAASLVRRDAFPVPGSIKLWEIYLRHALWSCRDLEFLPVRYEDLVRDPEPVARTIHDFLAARGLRLPAFAPGSVTALVASELRHFEVSDDDVLCERQRRLQAMAESGRVDEQELRATESDCRLHREDLLDLTVRSLRASVERAEDAAVFQRQQAEASRRAHAADRAAFDDERVFLRRQTEQLERQCAELREWVENRNEAIEWWQRRSEEAEARAADLQQRCDALMARTERSFLKRLFRP